jgi:hypothetical protein
MQTALPAPLILIATLKCPDKQEAEKREQFLLKQLAQYITRGEWLYVPDGELPKLIEIAFNSQDS